MPNRTEVIHTCCLPWGTGAGSDSPTDGRRPTAAPCGVPCGHLPAPALPARSPSRGPRSGDGQSWSVRRCSGRGQCSPLRSLQSRIRSVTGRTPVALTAVGSAPQETCTPFIGNTPLPGDDGDPRGRGCSTGSGRRSRPSDRSWVASSCRGGVQGVTRVSTAVVVEHTAAISPRPDVGASWPDEGGAARRPMGSMEVGHTVHSRHTSGKVRGHARSHRRVGDS